MEVSLTPKLEDLVRRKVESGLYHDASDVVREALRRLAAQDEATETKLATLRQALIDGERSGIADDFSMDRLMTDLDDEARRDGIGDG